MVQVVAVLVRRACIRLLTFALLSLVHFRSTSFQVVAN